MNGYIQDQPWSLQHWIKGCCLCLDWRFLHTDCSALNLFTSVLDLPPTLHFPDIREWAIFWSRKGELKPPRNRENKSNKTTQNPGSLIKEQRHFQNARYIVQTLLKLILHHSSSCTNGTGFPSVDTVVTEAHEALRQSYVCSKEILPGSASRAALWITCCWTV